MPWSDIEVLGMISLGKEEHSMRDNGLTGHTTDVTASVILPVDHLIHMKPSIHIQMQQRTHTFFYTMK